MVVALAEREIESSASSAAVDLRPAINRVLERCLKDRVPPSRALTDEDLVRLTDAEADAILRHGYASLVSDALHRQRTARSGESSSGSDGPIRTPGMHPAQGRNPTRYQGLGKWLSIGGEYKTLLQFTEGDLSELERVAASQRRAWGRRAAWAKAARRSLKGHDAEALAELPEEILAELDAKAIKAWEG